MGILSILIPVFNEDIKGLADDLNKSMNAVNAEVEVLFADDASTNWNQSKINSDYVKSLDGLNYLIRDKNLGYCENRNQLAESAKGEYLLFLDADVRLLNENFISKWLEQIPSNIFLCGGNVYQSQKPKDPDKILKWKHGKKREEAAVSIRNMHPHLKFWASNFMVMKSLFLQAPFDRMSQLYGYNDTVYAYLLMKQNIPVKHIDNPVLNKGLLNTDEFLSRTQEAIKNLLFFEKQPYIEKDFKQFISLLSLERKLNLVGLSSFARTLLSGIENKIIKNLKSDNPNLRYLDLYKLHLLLQERSR